MASAQFLEAFLGQPGSPAAPVGNSLLAMPQAAPQQAKPAGKPTQSAPPSAPPLARDSGLRRFLGNLGDALLTANGGEPLYRQAQERRQLGAQLSQYLGADNPELAAIMAENPEAGMALFNANLAQKQQIRSEGRDQQRIGIAEGQLGLGERELGERIRSNQAGEQITTRGQDIGANTQLTLAQLRARESALDRQHAAAIASGNRQAAMQLEQLRHQNDLEIARLTGGNMGTETEVIEYPGAEAQPDTAWFGDNSSPATPTRRVTRERPITAPGAGGQVTSEQQYAALPSGATFTGPDGRTYRKP